MTTPQQPRICAWCGHEPHARFGCRYVIRTRDPRRGSEAPEVDRPCPCSKQDGL